MLNFRNIAQLGEIAALLEVSGYPKPGNVHRTQNFQNMTYEDFVAILKENGIELEESNNWDSNGTLEFDYGNIDDVPDSIELSDNSNHFKDSSDEIDKEKPVSDSGVIDSGDVEVEEVYVEE